MLVPLLQTILVSSFILAQSIPNCPNKAIIDKALWEAYSEEPVLVLEGRNYDVVIYISLKEGTSSVVGVARNGCMTILASGSSVTLSKEFLDYLVKLSDKTKGKE